MSGKRQAGSGGSRVTGSVIAGLLLVPATAIAAVAIVGSISSPPGAEALDDLVPETSSTIVDATSTSTTTIDSEGLSTEALVSACTVSAEALVTREFDGSISDVETAALDALRQICQDNGISVAGPPAPAPIVKVVKVQAPDQSTTTVTSASDDASNGASYEDEEDEEDDDDEEDEHDEEDDD